MRVWTSGWPGGSPRVAALAAAVVLAGAWATARAAAPTRAEVEARLQKGAHGPSPADMTELGAQAVPVLIQIADDRNATELLRTRAMNTLAFAHAAAAHNYLENFIIRNRPSSDAVDRLLLRKAAVSLGWQAGPRAVETLASLLDHPDADVRMDAVVALGLTRDRRAEKPLRARLPDETDAEVRAQIDRQLRTLEPEAAGAGPKK
jgi:hypothetical protein